MLVFAFCLCYLQYALPCMDQMTWDVTFFSVSYQGICYGWGDPHYVTFDGTYYGFQGNCSYWLVKEILPKYNFSVMIDNYYCGATDGLSCPQSIMVFYNSYRIFITQKDINGIFTNQVIKCTVTFLHFLSYPISIIFAFSAIATTDLDLYTVHTGTYIFYRYTCNSLPSKEGLSYLTNSLVKGYYWHLYNNAFCFRFLWMTSL